MVADSWEPEERVWCAAGALFRSQSGDVLLVEPVYKTTWEIPGGIVESGESPAAACRREVAEELGLTVPIGRLLCVDYVCPPFAGWEGLRFVFDGGILAGPEVGSIRLQSEELASWRFVAVSEAVNLVAAPLARRIEQAVAVAVAGGEARYLENGRPRPGS
ncbi:MAG: NUDIX hydrolase [Acidimicrobiia bacterium]|nr:NUDIX hydrolase [Acidimicrobiia bacterium]